MSQWMGRAEGAVSRGASPSSEVPEKLPGDGALGTPGD